jgi:hypothetical protein
LMHHSPAHHQQSGATRQVRKSAAVMIGSENPWAR